MAYQSVHWTELNIAQRKDFANWSTGMQLGTDVDKDIVIPFCEDIKANSHL